MTTQLERIAGLIVVEPIERYVRFARAEPHWAMVESRGPGSGRNPAQRPLGREGLMGIALAKPRTGNTN